MCVWKAQECANVWVWVWVLVWVWVGVLVCVSVRVHVCVCARTIGDCCYDTHWDTPHLPRQLPSCKES